MTNLFREGIAQISGSLTDIAIFVEKDDLMITTDDSTYFINIKYGGYFSVGDREPEPMYTRVTKALKILEGIEKVENIYNMNPSLIEVGSYQIPIPSEITDIQWNGDARKNGRPVRSNYQYFKLDVFGELERRSSADVQ